MACEMRTTLLGTTALTSGLDIIADRTLRKLSSWGTLITAWLGMPGGAATADITAQELSASEPTARASSPASTAAAVTWMAAARAL